MATDWKEIESKYYMYCARRQPVVLVRGEGTRVWDDAGKEYLDFTAGWAVNNIGHANPVVADAVAEQARTLLQTSNQFYTVPQLQLAEVLVENSCLDKVFISNSGAEANEGASSWPASTGRCIGTGPTRSSPRTTLFTVERSLWWLPLGSPTTRRVSSPCPPGSRTSSTTMWKPSRRPPPTRR